MINSSLTLNMDIWARPPVPPLKVAPCNLYFKCQPETFNDLWEFSGKILILFLLYQYISMKDEAYGK